jgi:hypothetical protein
MCKTHSFVVTLPHYILVDDINARVSSIDEWTELLYAEFLLVDRVEIFNPHFSGFSPGKVDFQWLIFLNDRQRLTGG